MIHKTCTSSSIGVHRAMLFVVEAEPFHDWDVSEATSILLTDTELRINNINFNKDIASWSGVWGEGKMLFPVRVSEVILCNRL